MAGTGTSTQCRQANGQHDTLKDGYKTVLSLDSSGPRVTLYVPDSPLAPLSLGPASAAPAAASVSGGQGQGGEAPRVIRGSY